MRKVSRRGVAAGRVEAKSLSARLAPSSGAQGSNGIQRRKGRPRMDKREQESRLRGAGNLVKDGGRMMRFAGIDIGSELHMVAVLDEEGEVLCRSSRFAEDAAGYERLFEVLGPPDDCLVAMEATGHYWQNLFVALIAKDYQVAVVNPLRTARFAEEELRRTKTDAIDALGIARFAQQKRPRPAQLPDAVTEELRELERLRERLVEDFAGRLRQLHRAVDLGFPEFTRYVRTLESQLAITILSRYPTAASFQGVSVKKLARIVYDGSHQIGEDLARNLIEAAERSVGAHHSEPYRIRIKYLCEDLEVLRRRLRDLARDVGRKVREHEIGKLIMTIEGVGPLTTACLLAELGDPARFDSPGAVASYVGVIPRIRQSGKKRFAKGPAIPLGNARLRKSLWMAVLQLIRRNAWLRQHYERLRAAGKPGKVAVIAAMRKLLAAVWSVATHRKPFVPILPVCAAANNA
jgi:transposase